MNKFRLDLQFFAEEEVGDLLSYLGVENNSDANTAAPEATNSEATSTEPTGNTDTGNNQNTADNSKPEQKPSESEQKPTDQDTKNNEDKQAHAFAQLRAEAAQKKQLLTGLQKVLNIPEDTPLEDVMVKVQESIIKAQSKQTGVPEEILTKLDRLEQRDKEYQAHQLQENAYIGFSKIQKEFGLNQDGIRNFAMELFNANLNPFEQDIDVLQEYKVRHLNDIIAAEVAKAVKSEQERAAKAGTQSTKPGNVQGQTQGESTDKINSIKELDKWLSTQNK